MNKIFGERGWGMTGGKRDQRQVARKFVNREVEKLEFEVDEDLVPFWAEDAVEAEGEEASNVQGGA